MLKYIIIYLSAMSLLTFILFGADKHKARAHKWRIPEKTLLGLSLLGGFAGGFLGMEFFRHKTKNTISKTFADRSAEVFCAKRVPDGRFRGVLLRIQVKTSPNS